MLARARLSPLLPSPLTNDTVGMSVGGVLGRFLLNGLGRVIAEGEGDCLTRSAVLCPTLSLGVGVNACFVDCG